MGRRVRPSVAGAPASEEVRPGFRAFVARTLGPEGRSWLDALQDTVAEAERRLDVRCGAELPGGLLSFVCAAETVGGSAVVLKVAGPWDRPADESLTLRAWDGSGAPRLIDEVPDLGALLLERVVPGTTAAPTPDAVGGLLRILHVPAPPGLPDLDDVVRERLARAVAERRISADRAAHAAELVGELTEGGPAPRLVHGDFTARNLLDCARRGLVAIDPLPGAGDPAYDAATWAHAWGAPGHRERQAALATALDLDPDRVRRWGVVVAAHR